MKSPRWSWLALGLGAYIAFTIAQFPAATAYRWFGGFASDLRLAGISGTIWNGEAALGSVPGLPMHDLAWRLGAAPLLLGRAAVDFDLRLADGFVRGHLDASPRTLAFDGVQAATSLTTLGTLLPLQGARGMVSLAIDELAIRSEWPVAADLLLRVRQIEVPPLAPGGTPGLVPLGDYEVSNVEIAERRLSADLRDTGGPLEVVGTVALALAEARTLAGAVPTFDGRVRERDSLPEALRQPLDFLTVERDAEGWRTLDLNPWLSAL
jgi:hypothetical protein